MFRAIKYLCWKYFKFSRPKALKVKGRLIIDRNSEVYFDSESEWICDGDLELENSTIVLNHSKIIFKGGKIRNSRMELKNSSLYCGESADWFHADLTATKTELKTGAHFRFHYINVHFLSSLIKTDDYCFWGGFKNSAIRVQCLNGKISFGINNRIQAGISVNGGNLLTGNHVFVNSGTLLACRGKIMLGNYVMVSYNCVLIDYSSHSLQAADRRKEIDEGFPNGTKPDENRLKESAGSIELADDVWIGAGATLLKGAVIAKANVIGAGVCLRNKTPELSLVKAGTINEITQIKPQ